MKQLNIDKVSEETVIDTTNKQKAKSSIAEIIANDLPFETINIGDVMLEDAIDFSKIIIKDLDSIEIIRIATDLLNKKYSKTYIANYLGITRRTLYKYLNMRKEDLNKPRKQRRRKDEFELYKPHIIRLLNESPELSSSQVHFLLTVFFQEFYGDMDYELTVSKNTVNNYCNSIRKEYSIIKPILIPQQRDYIAQTHDIIGKYMQVDLGEYRIDITNVTSIKVYFIVFTLCFSRMMYVDFLNRPFKSKDVVVSHLRAFKYFGGATDMIIYDQDTRILSKENFGDYEYTREFENFVNEYKIKPLFCYASDPESKGVVENGVKFVKQHFLNGRRYKSLDVLRCESLNWCNQVSKRVHGTTLKKPEKLFQLEKQQLHQVQIQNEISYDILTRSISKYNTISFEGNKYTLPIGTYSLGQRYTRCEFITKSNEEYIRLYKVDTNVLLWEHKRYHKGSGKFISDPEHRGETIRVKAIEKAIEKFVELFSNKQIAIDYAEFVVIEYASRRREIVQLNQLYQIANMYIQKNRDTILEYCALNKIYGQNSFSEVAIKIATGNRDKINEVVDEREDASSVEHDYINSELEKYNNLILKGDIKKC